MTTEEMNKAFDSKQHALVDALRRLESRAGDVADTLGSFLRDVCAVELLVAELRAIVTDTSTDSTYAAEEKVEAITALRIKSVNLAKAREALTETCALLSDAMNDLNKTVTP